MIYRCRRSLAERERKLYAAEKSVRSNFLFDVFTTELLGDGTTLSFENVCVP